MRLQTISIRISEEQMRQFGEFLYERENARATIQKYQRDIKAFWEFLGEEKVITKLKLLEYKERLVKRYKVSSVNSMIAALNQFLVFLDGGQLKVKPVKTQNALFLQEEKELTKKEYEKLLKAARSEGKEQLALCMETIAATGIRISELKYFTLELVKKGRIEIWNKGKYRKIFLPSMIRKKLLEFCKKKQIKSGYIFTTKNGKPKDRSNIWKEMKALKEKAGVSGSKIFPHNLRHFFARTYYHYTKDIAGLADLLGHSSLNVTRIYTANTGEIYQSQLDEMVEKSRCTT